MTFWPSRGRTQVAVVRCYMPASLSLRLFCGRERSFAPNVRRQCQQFLCVRLCTRTSVLQGLPNWSGYVACSAMAAVRLSACKASGAPPALKHVKEEDATLLAPDLSVTTPLVRRALVWSPAAPPQHVEDRAHLQGQAMSARRANIGCSRRLCAVTQGWALAVLPPLHRALGGARLSIRSRRQPLSRTTWILFLHRPLALQRARLRPRERSLWRTRRLRGPRRAFVERCVPLITHGGHMRTVRACDM